MLKKQTVWLLTMLSLMIVLSVYYIFSPPNPNEIAFQSEENEETQDNQNNEDGNEINDDEAGDAEVTNISSKGQDELFTMMRMEVQNERSMSKERYNNIVKSSSASTEEKNEALDSIETIDQRSTKETILQEKIMSGSDDFADVFIRHDNDKVHVHLRADDEISKQEANNIMQLVRNEFGEVPVDVNFDPSESE